ncbi:MAG: hypothetical protein PVF65_11935, partial [Sphingomonadales bacterium]
LSGTAEIFTAGNLSLVAEQNLTLSGNTQVTGLANLNADIIEVNGVIAVGGSAFLNAANGITVTGDVSSLDSIALNSAGRVTVDASASLATTGNIWLQGGQGAIVSGLLLAENNIGLQIIGDASISGELQSGNTTNIDATGAILHSGTLLSGNSVGITGSAINIGGSISTNDVLSIQALTGSAEISGNLLADGATALVADAGDVRLAANAILGSNAGIEINSAGLIENAGLITALDGLQLTAQRELLNSGSRYCLVGCYRDIQRFISLSTKHYPKRLIV